MIIKNGKTITSIMKGNQVISKIMKGTLVVYESWKNLLASGVPPLTLLNSVGKDLLDYKLYGNSKQGILPSEYQELEYIENERGTKFSYINTGVIPNSNTGIDLVYQAMDVTNSQYILGTRESTINYAMNGSQSRTDWDIRFDGTPIYSNVARTTDKWQSKITMTNGTGTWEITNLDVGTSKTISISNKTVTATLPLGLFCYNAITETATRKYVHNDLRVYSCKIYDGETLIRDFIPCYRKSDEVIGMYDLVNDVFYTSAGNGEFTKGSNIPTQDIPIEVESVGEKTKNLFDKTLWESKITQNGLTIQYLKEEDCFLLNGTAISTTQFGFKYINMPINKNNTFSLSVKYVSGTITKPSESFAVAYFGKNNEINNSSNWVNVSMIMDDYKRENNVCDTNYITAFWFFITSGVSFDNYKIKIQLEEGTVATDYEPYGYRIPVKVSNGTEEITTNIFLNEPLRKVGDYADYIDFENSKVVRKVGVQTFDGTETWTKHTTTSEGYGAFRSDDLLTPLIGAPITATYMTHFNLTDKGATADFVPGEYRFTYSSGSLIAGSRLYVSAEQTTVEEFKEWLVNNKPSIYYPIATPIEETIELPNIPTIKGTTILSVDTTIQPSNLEVVYKGKEVK